MTPDKLTALLDTIDELAKGATPAPWKYDWGNWEVEGPHPDRYPICAMSPSDRAPGFTDQPLNPADSPADGQLIAALRNCAEAMSAVCRAANDLLNKGPSHADCPLIDLGEALERLSEVKL